MPAKIKSLFAAFVTLGLLYGCSGNPAYTPSPFDTETIDPAAYVPRVDAFVVILDASASMGNKYQGRSKYIDAMDVVYRLNQTIPQLDYQSGLTAYSSGTCLGGDSTQMLYGMTGYQRAAFDSALRSVACAGGTTPMAGAIDASTSHMSSTPGDTAVIIVSDFSEVEATRVARALDNMQAATSGRLCVHTITVSDNAWDRQVADTIASGNDCSSSVGIADVASPDSMAAYVKGVLLAAATGTAVIQYEKNTMSTAALFDFDSAVLKESGKAALHELGDAIKAKGARVVDIDIIGHTDSTGPADYNMGLSLRRAEAVRDYIVSEGIDAGIIDVSGEGENSPVASNDTAAGRAENRRVDINVGVEQAGN